MMTKRSLFQPIRNLVKVFDASKDPIDEEDAHNQKAVKSFGTFGPKSKQAFGPKQITGDGSRSPFLTLPIEVKFIPGIPGKELRDLPTEIWIKILTMVVDPEEFFHDRCSSFDFPRFIHEWTILGQSPISDYRGRIGEVRLVCRAWSMVVNPRQTPYANVAQLSQLPPRQNVHVLCVGDQVLWEHYRNASPKELDPAIIETLQSVNTLIMYRILSRPNQFIESIPSNPIHFPNVRSFSYTLNSDLPQAFWSRLQVAFPNLTALKIRSNSHARGSITLLKLEILQLEVLTPPECHFPQLRHLSSDRNLDHSLFSGFLYSHSHTLESILVPFFVLDGPKVFHKGFWTQFPQIRLLGVRSYVLRDLPAPPTSHPFDHLCIYDQPSLDVQALLVRFRTLRYVSIIDTGYDTALADKIAKRDVFLRESGMVRLSIRLYGKDLPVEVANVGKEASWSNSEHFTIPFGMSYACVWKFQSKKDEMI